MTDAAVEHVNASYFRGAIVSPEAARRIERKLHEAHAQILVLREALEENSARWQERECRCDPRQRGSPCNKHYCLSLNQSALDSPPPPAVVSKAEYAGLEEKYRGICGALHASVRKHKLGLGGEHIDKLVCEALDASQSILQACLAAMPVGNLATHTAEHLAGRIAEMAQELAAESLKREDAERAVVELNERLIERTQGMLTRIVDVETAARRRVREAERDAAALAGEIQCMLASASPHPTEQPTMFIRWKTAAQVLAAHEARSHGVEVAV